MKKRYPIAFSFKFQFIMAIFFRVAYTSLIQNQERFCCDGFNGATHNAKRWLEDGRESLIWTKTICKVQKKREKKYSKKNEHYGRISPIRCFFGQISFVSKLRANEHSMIRNQSPPFHFLNLKKKYNPTGHWFDFTLLIDAQLRLLFYISHHKTCLT